MLKDRRNYAGWKLFSRQRFQDLRLRQVRIVQNDRNDLRMSFGKKRPRNARGSSPR